MVIPHWFSLGVCQVPVGPGVVYRYGRPLNLVAPASKVPAKTQVRRSSSNSLKAQQPVKYMYTDVATVHSGHSRAGERLGGRRWATAWALTGMCRWTCRCVSWAPVCRRRPSRCSPALPAPPCARPSSQPAWRHMSYTRASTITKLCKGASPARLLHTGCINSYDVIKGNAITIRLSYTST